MKIVNVYKNENEQCGHNYEVQFEAELYHSEINPKISFVKNDKNEMCLNFKNWNTEEAIDALTPDQAEEVLMTLVEAVNFARHYEIEEGPTLFDETEEVNVESSK